MVDSNVHGIVDQRPDGCSAPEACPALCFDASGIEKLGHPICSISFIYQQVEDLTDGAITGTSLQLSMCVGVGVSVGLSMLRVILGINVLWFIIPGYALALAMSFLCPKLFTAIAFDSGGVASGPMTAAFLLPMTMGFCTAMGGNIATDAFGVVALVAMTPLITIQGLGMVYRFKTRRRKLEKAVAVPFAGLPNDAVIEL